MSETTKTLPFIAHNSLIKQIIFRQHSEHFKAIVELIQNSIDAKATQIELRFDETGFVVDDNGTGFPSEESVTDYFQTFGTPHVDGDATFGMFRIGRGQIMSLADCTWRTNLWQMDVDIQNEKEPEPSFKLTYQQLLESRKEITDFVRNVIGGTKFWHLKMMIDDALSASTGKSYNIMGFWWRKLYKIDKNIDAMSVKELKKLTY